MPDDVRACCSRARRRQTRRARGERMRGSPRGGRRIPDVARASTPRASASSPPISTRSCSTACGPSSRARRASTRRRALRAPRPLRAVHWSGGSADLAGSTTPPIVKAAARRSGREPGRRSLRRPQPPLRRARARDGRDRERHGARRRRSSPYGGTFLIFTDYMRPAIRLAALHEGADVVFVFTHDSIFVGEDGPTHQPVEQLDALRVDPRADGLPPRGRRRDRDGVGVALGEAHGPVALALTRQDLPLLAARTPGRRERSARRLRRAARPRRRRSVVLVATGSEVSLAGAAAERAATQGVAARVVSMPSSRALR